MIYWYELKKLLKNPVLMGFVLLCLGLNALLVLAVSPGTEGSSPGDTGALSDIFDGLDTEYLSEFYIARLGIEGEYADNIRQKYAELQPVVEEKGRRDESLSPYFGIDTRFMHRHLFRDVFGAVALEGCLTALYAALLSTGYERNQNTEGMVYASKTGRHVQRKKFLSVMTVSGICFCLLLGTTLLLYFLRFDYSSVWQDFVSSLFNFSVSDRGKPFITWQSFTVSQFILGYCTISAGLVTAFAWFGFALGTFVRSGCAAVAAAIGSCVFLFALEQVLPYGSQVRNGLNLMPVPLLINIGNWFTDGYANVLWRNFECWGVILSLAASAAAVWVAMLDFARRDMA